MNKQTLVQDWVVRECECAADHERLFRFRYREYVEKKGHFLDSADHVNKRLEDPVDSFCTNFIAEADGEIIGSIRLNRFDKFLQAFCITEYEIQKISPEIFTLGCTVARAIVRPDWQSRRVFVALVLAAARYFRDNKMRWMLVSTSTARQAGDEARFISFYRSLGFTIWRKDAVVPEIGAGNVLLLDLKLAMADSTGPARRYLGKDNGPYLVSPEIS